ncbi:hypothetical protein A2U01_0117260, partial [Trifolium medium]|nr:hypothetical protein [Trifolium medium]
SVETCRSQGVRFISTPSSYPS